jgi:hypothetical protein
MTQKRLSHIAALHVRNGYVQKLTVDSLMDELFMSRSTIQRKTFALGGEL